MELQRQIIHPKQSTSMATSIMIWLQQYNTQSTAYDCHFVTGRFKDEARRSKLGCWDVRIEVLTSKLKFRHATQILKLESRNSQLETQICEFEHQNSKPDIWCPKFQTRALNCIIANLIFETRFFKFEIHSFVLKFDAESCYSSLETCTSWSLESWALQLDSWGLKRETRS